MSIKEGLCDAVFCSNKKCQECPDNKLCAMHHMMSKLKMKFSLEIL